MSDTKTAKTAWLSQVQEEIIDPDREIIDPHHHFWVRRDRNDYMLADLWEDTSSGHNIVKTVYAECGSGYYEDGPEHLRSVGESVFVEKIAAQSRDGASKGHPIVAALVGRADLRIGAQLDEVLDAHEEAGKGLFRGIRQALARAPDDVSLLYRGGAPKDLYKDRDFHAGVNRLGARGLTYDTWHFHMQNPEFFALAKACPNTQMVFDHLGNPLGVGRFSSQREEIFEQWKIDIEDIAKCENVVAKVGGLAMPDNGFGWHERAAPPSSDEVVEAQSRYYTHIIECFGPERCMFESNFPVDKHSLSYQVYWNAMKKIAAPYSEDEKTAMFCGTAARIYSV
jgi:predicted TIM-barrel fold metal-dependent hydrolase